MAAFGNVSLRHRLARGGLPPFFLAETSPARDFQEWMDAYWAKDILELFRLERRQSFQRLFELLLAQSGGIFEATALARPSEVSRTTVMNYLAVLEATFVMHVVRPFAAGGAAEIVAAPKVYGFDTGFVSYHRGWDEPRGDELGSLWEHFVLNELHAHFGRSPVRYWRTSTATRWTSWWRSHAGEPDGRSSASGPAGDFDPASLQAFRRRYAKGENFVVASDVKQTFTKRFGETQVRFVSLDRTSRTAARQDGGRRIGAVTLPVVRSGARGAAAQYFASVGSILSIQARMPPLRFFASMPFSLSIATALPLRLPDLHCTMISCPARQLGETAAAAGRAESASNRECGRSGNSCGSRTSSRKNGAFGRSWPSAPRRSSPAPPGRQPTSRRPAECRRTPRSR